MTVVAVTAVLTPLVSSMSSAVAGSYIIDGTACSASQLGQVAPDDDGMGDVYDSGQVVITQFTPINVAPGTTGSHTTSLSQVATVSTTETDTNGYAISATAGFNVALIKVSAMASSTYSYTTSTVVGTADTTTVSMTWNFNQPGYYGLYQGTHELYGYTQDEVCSTNYQGHPYAWKAITHHFITYSPLEEGTVVCDNTGLGWFWNDETTPISAVAKKMLGSC